MLVTLVAIGEPQRADGRAAQLREEGIVVNGVGVVRSVPDRARLSFGVEAEGRTATGAFGAAGAAMRRVVAALEHAGIARADLRTEQLSLEPRTSDDGSDVVGSVAVSSVGVIVRDLGRAGAVIDAAVTAGANQVYGPSLERSDREELYRAALRAAVADARARAAAIAAAAGLSLGSVTSVEEGGGDVQPEPPSAAAAVRSDLTPVEPGSEEIEAAVVVSFAVA
jgi:hypothetical protein